MRFRWIGLLCALLASTGAWSQRHQLHVPQILDDWRDWVLQDQRHRLCPLLYDREGKAPADFVCAWPGRLRLSITPEGGRFEQEWTLFGDDQWVPLPGDANNWPQDVAVDGGALTLVLRQDAPAVLLPPGSHRITGAFSWSERPPTLSAPAHSGLLTLSVDGVEIAQPRWERALSGMGAGAVWLGDWRPETVVQDELSVRVHRRIEDGVPTRRVRLGS